MVTQNNEVESFALAISGRWWVLQRAFYMLITRRLRDKGLNQLYQPSQNQRISAGHAVGESTDVNPSPGMNHSGTYSSNLGQSTP